MSAINRTVVPNYLSNFSGDPSVSLAPHSDSYIYSVTSQGDITSDLMGIDGEQYPSFRFGNFTSTSPTNYTQYKRTDNTYSSREGYGEKKKMTFRREGYKDYDNRKNVYSNDPQLLYKKENYVDYHKSRKNFVSNNPQILYRKGSEKKNDMTFRREGYADIPRKNTATKDPSIQYQDQSEGEDITYETLQEGADSTPLAGGFNYAKVYMDMPTSLGYVAGQDNVYNTRKAGEGGQMNHTDGRQFVMGIHEGYNHPSGTNAGSQYMSL